MDSQIQEGIDKARNLNRIKTSIQVIRELEQFKNTNPIWCSDEIAIPTYFMYKDLHAVERILLNKYEEDLKWVYWVMHKYITNIIQKALFEERDELAKLGDIVNEIIHLEGISSDKGIYDEINYIENRELIIKEFDKMVTWLHTKEYNPTFEREVYNSGFLKK